VCVCVYICVCVSVCVCVCVCIHLFGLTRTPNPQADYEAARAEGERVSRVIRIREETISRRPVPQPQLFGSEVRRITTHMY